MSLFQATLEKIVANALQEDLGRGDLTTEACVDADLRGTALLRARHQMTYCGSPVVREVFRQLDPGVCVTIRCGEGKRLGAGEIALVVEGAAASILEGERVALNFVRRLSGIATLARAYVDRVPAGCSARITDTRKTTPGLRVLERYAVRCGGAVNHRQDLGSAIMIKDNHLAACGGNVGAAVRRARDRAPHTSRVTCEVDTIDQLKEALEAGADVVVLDNFDDDRLHEAVAVVDGRALIEVSGGVTLERVAAIARAGADIISVGELTHSVPAADLGLDWVRVP